jgi:hypothetical protein
MFCNGYTYLPGISDVCCKCFNSFERRLQVFHLDIVKVDLVLHILQWDSSAVAAEPAYMRMGVEGA